jgi:hypothetical protein
MALNNTQIAINLANSVIERFNFPDQPEEAAKMAVIIYETILNNLPAPKPKEIKRLPL